MRSGGIVIESPFFDRMARVEYRRECVLVQKLVAKSTIKALDASILRRFTGIDEVLRNSSQSCPFKHLVAGELAAIIGFQDFWKRTARDCISCQHCCNARARQGKVDFDRNAFTREIINDRQRSKSAHST